MRRFSRRALLGGAGALTATALAGGRRSSLADTALSFPTGTGGVANALAVLGRSVLRSPDSLPFPDRAPGTDTLPQVEHIVVLMMENHSYDNLFGVLPSARAGGGRADGLPLGAPVTTWNPYGVAATNPTADGRVQSAFLMPTTCQLPSRPSQEWTASHNAYDGGRMDGFVRTPISFTDAQPVGGVAMGYWDESLLPFTAGLAQAFPIADRWFSATLGQTDPNRRFLIAATASGMTDDISLSTSSPGISMVEQDALLATPANGTIFDRLSAFGISWRDYNASYPTGTTAELYPLDDAAVTAVDAAPIAQFFTDCASGALPGFSLLDPDYGTRSQENPQDMAAGEAFLARVVQAVGASPAWATTLLVICYDEHGGYYDHVAPPAALAPDAVPPVVQPGQSAYDGFCRYGFRVPAVVVSPYALPGAVTHVVHDHTSVLALVERKWNLPAMTFRDANANDLLDFLDLGALRDGRPTFPSLPPLPAPGPSMCPSPAPAVPPPGSVSG